jgi:hypothetical protein
VFEAARRAGPPRDQHQGRTGHRPRQEGHQVILSNVLIFFFEAYVPATLFVAQALHHRSGKRQRDVPEREEDRRIAFLRAQAQGRHQVRPELERVRPSTRRAGQVLKKSTCSKKTQKKCSRKIFKLNAINKTEVAFSVHWHTRNPSR